MVNTNIYIFTITRRLNNHISIDYQITQHINLLPNIFAVFFSNTILELM